MKGILLAGGKATRLHPITKIITKHLLPVYDKPMIYYSLSLLMYAGISEILVITDQEYLNDYKRILGNGNSFGITLTYMIQSSPNGIAQALLLGEEFIGNSDVCLVLGDTILYSPTLALDIATYAKELTNCLLISCYHPHPKYFGVATFDKNNNIVSIEEKPINSSSNHIIPGIYFYDNQCVSFSKKIQPSKRGELEITDVNKMYLNNNQLVIKQCSQLIYFDAGRYDSLLDASNFIREKRLKENSTIGDLVVIGKNQGWI
ncbi:MAG: NTP transferase domain-containing protein [Clostridiales bacterium]|nr:NTP transferase domain-containing protein [Clostridiales bacterium]